jgi:hypothetical protein
MEIHDSTLVVSADALRFNENVKNTIQAANTNGYKVVDVKYQHFSGSYTALILLHIPPGMKRIG